MKRKMEKLLYYDERQQPGSENSSNHQIIGNSQYRSDSLK